MTLTIGFAGIGNMGTSIVMNLLRGCLKGDVAVYFAAGGSERTCTTPARYKSSLLQFSEEMSGE